MMNSTYYSEIDKFFDELKKEKSKSPLDFYLEEAKAFEAKLSQIKKGTSPHSKETYEVRH